MLFLICFSSCSPYLSPLLNPSKQVVIGTKVGRTKHLRIMPGGALETEQSLSSSGPSSMFVGKKLDEHRGSFLLEYPMDKGHIVDGGWDAMEALWEVRRKLCKA